MKGQPEFPQDDLNPSSYIVRLVHTGFLALAIGALLTTALPQPAASPSSPPANTLTSPSPFPSSPAPTPTSELISPAPSLTPFFPAPGPVSPMPRRTPFRPPPWTPSPGPVMALTPPPAPISPPRKTSGFGKWFVLSCALALVLSTGVRLFLKYRRNFRYRTRPAWEAGTRQSEPRSKPTSPPYPESAPTLADQAERTVDMYLGTQPALATLKVLQSQDPTYVGKTVLLTQDRVTLGRRGDNDIPFPKDASVSRRHAVLRLENGVFFLEPPPSGPPKHGIFVNDAPVQGPTPLQDGDIIQLGHTVRLRFRVLGENTLLPVV